MILTANCRCRKAECRLLVNDHLIGRSGQRGKILQPIPAKSRDLPAVFHQSQIHVIPHTEYPDCSVCPVCQIGVGFRIHLALLFLFFQLHAQAVRNVIHPMSLCFFLLIILLQIPADSFRSFRPESDILHFQHSVLRQQRQHSCHLHIVLMLDEESEHIFHLRHVVRSGHFALLSLQKNCMGIPLFKSRTSMQIVIV